MTAVVFQLLKGYARFELGHYLLWFVLPGVICAVLLAVLSVFVQVLVPHKFIGWAVMLLYMVGHRHAQQHRASSTTSTTTPARPAVPLSDMNGMGRFWIGRAWFQAYWLAFALMLVVLAYCLWRARRGDAPASRASRACGDACAARRPALLGVAAAGLGGHRARWIYYNTNVLNEYVTAAGAGGGPGRVGEGAAVATRPCRSRGSSTSSWPWSSYPRDVRAVTRGRVRASRTGPASRCRAVHVRWPGAARG